LLVVVHRPLFVVVVVDVCLYSRPVCRLTAELVFF